MSKNQGFTPKNKKVNKFKIGDVVRVVRHCPNVYSFFVKYLDGKTPLTVLKLNKNVHAESCGSGHNRGVCSQMWQKLDTSQRILDFKETNMHCCSYPLSAGVQKRKTKSATQLLRVPERREWRNIIES